MKNRRRDKKGRFINEEHKYPAVIRVTVEDKEYFLKLRDKRQADREKKERDEKNEKMEL